MLKEKIARYKAERDHKIHLEQNANAVAKQNAKTNSIMGKLKENALPIIGGIALVSAFVYVQKSTPKRKRKVVV